MNKKLVVSGLAAIALFIGGCGADPDAPTPFDQSIKENPYDSTAVEVDDRYLALVKEKLGDRYNQTKTDEEYIKYGKAICILLDNSKSAPNAEIVIDELAQPISDSALEVYCPHHLED